MPFQQEKLLLGAVRLLRGLARRVRHFLPHPTFDAASYWEQRHQRHSGSLRSVGHIKQSDADNTADYAVKVRHMMSAISRAGGALKGKAILDAGCGIGILTKLMIDAEADVYAVDISPTAIAAARQRVPNARFECRSLETLSYQAVFDVIVSMDVLFHIVDDAKWNRVLSCLGSAVKLGGVIVIQEDLTETGVTPPHVRWRTLEDYRKALTKTGLRITDLETYTLPRQTAQKTILTIRTVQSSFGLRP